MQRTFLSASLVLALGAGFAPAAVLITEVHSTGSSGPAGADWFELTNTGDTAVDLTGWRIDDSSAVYTSGSLFRGITSLPAKSRVVFAEANSGATNDASIKDAFIANWFNGAAPSGFLIGSYGGSGIGLSSSGDAVNVFNASQVIVASVSFGAGTTGVSFDNTAGLNASPISTLSTVGTNAAFLSSPGGETGSPGLPAIPEPTSLALLGLGALAMVRRRARA